MDLTLKPNALFAQLKKEYTEIILIISPPRSSSTALARAFWEHPAVRYYAHEPFEPAYYLGHTFNQVIQKLKYPLEVRDLKNHANGTPLGNGLVIKEMPYQVGEHFRELVQLATLPIIFLMRNPRRNIASRIRKKLETGSNPHFPLVETGWELLYKQITFCKENGIPHLIVDAQDLRNRPQPTLQQLFSTAGLQVFDNAATWKPHPEIDLDNLGGMHTHLYREVLNSSGLMPENSPAPPLDSFPDKNGLRQHVRVCMQIYQALRDRPELIRPQGQQAEESFHPGV